LSSEQENRDSSGFAPEEPKQSTRREKIHNWLTYNIGWVVGALFLLWLIGSVIADYQKKPAYDVRVAYVGSERLSDSAVAAIETTLARYCADANGDGDAVVTVVQYEIPSLFFPTIRGLAEYMDQSALAGDLEAEQSELFLLEDAAAFQRAYVRLELPEGNGALPEREDISGDCNSVRWSDCPALTELPLSTGESELLLFDEDREAIENLELCLRGYSTEESKQAHACASALWDRIVQGAEKSS